MHIDSIEANALSVPLREPFVIASGRIEATRAALVTVDASDAEGKVVRGYGEAAALPPVTREDQPDFFTSIPHAARILRARVVGDPGDLDSSLDQAFPRAPAARAGLECALLDAMARLRGVPLYGLLAPNVSHPATLTTDITLSIHTPDTMAQTAETYRAQGFRLFKVKVGVDREADRAALAAVQRAVPDARFRLDANGGFSAADALRLLDDVVALGLHIECFEQPCAADDLEGMAQVTAASAGVPIVADESVKTVADADRIARQHAAHAVNLKLAKSGGLRAALTIGRRARELGLRVMVGGMVETRLGMTAMAHVACALGGVDYVDLDTAWLLADDPFEGGYRADGPTYTLPAAPGLAVRPRPYG